MHLRLRRTTALALMALLSACTADRSATAPIVPDQATSADVVGIVAATATTTTVSATVGVPFVLDASRLTFTGLRGTRLLYTVSFAPSANGLSALAGRITGTPLAVGTVVATVTATDANGQRAVRTFTIVVARLSVAISVSAANSAQAATVGTAYVYDATRSGTTFTGGNSALTYTVTFAPTANGLLATNGRITGTPTSTGTTTATIVARDATGQTASNSFAIVSFAADLVAPTLPGTLLSYSDASAPLPAHFTAANAPGGGAIAADNTPATNAITNAGATLGRVLFYDRRLSLNDRVACGSCHQQQFAFGDTARLSRGFADGLTGRHSMALANARFYANGRFFWDERAASLEDQVLQPIQNTTEMGMTLPLLVTKLAVSPYYASLFQAAFGTAEITTDRVSRALAQFVRSMVSGTSKFDQAFSGPGAPNFTAVFTANEVAGQALFTGAAGCVRCHGTNALISDNIHNTGLDATVTDVGAGNGRFKSPSLRNIAVRAPYMHDGRFATLEQVVEFYNSGVQANPNLDPRLRAPNGTPQRLNLTATQKAQLVAYLRTLTDNAFMTNPKFASPFSR